MSPSASTWHPVDPGQVEPMGGRPLPDALPGAAAVTSELAQLPSGFTALDAATQERLINWGYASCDAAVRKHFIQGAAPSPGFPYPDVRLS